MPAASAVLRCAASTPSKNRSPTPADRSSVPVRRPGLRPSAASPSPGTHSLAPAAIHAANGARRWGSLPSPALPRSPNCSQRSTFCAGRAPRRGLRSSCRSRCIRTPARRCRSRRFRGAMRRSFRSFADTSTASVFCAGTARKIRRARTRKMRRETPLTNHHRSHRLPKT